MESRIGRMARGLLPGVGRPCVAACAVALGVAATGNAGVVTVASDIFDTHATVSPATNSIAAGPDTGNMSYAADGSQVTVTTDSASPGFGAKALTNSTAAGTPIVATMPTTVSLVNVGDQIKLSFAYHLVGAPAFRASSASACITPTVPPRWPARWARQH